MARMTGHLKTALPQPKVAAPPCMGLDAGQDTFVSISKPACKVPPTAACQTLSKRSFPQCSHRQFHSFLSFSASNDHCFEAWQSECAPL
jgi:hypothetical protein